MEYRKAGAHRALAALLLDRSRSEAASSREFPLLEALLAEHRPPLGRTERNSRVFPARRASGLCLDAISKWRRARGCAIRPLRLACLAALRLVLELLVSEKQLLARCPDELSSAIYTPQGLVLELHRSPPRELAIVTRCYSDSRRSFLRFRLRAKACFARRLSPGFK
jgi:hypothetical protein